MKLYDFSHVQIPMKKQHTTSEKYFQRELLKAKIEACIIAAVSIAAIIFFTTI